MFSFFRSKKQTPVRFELLKRQALDATQFERVQQLCLDLENEKATAYEHDPERDPRRQYRQFLAKTHCHRAVVLGLVQDEKRLTLDKGLANHQAREALQSLLDNQLAWTEGADYVIIPDIVLAGLSEKDRAVLDFYEPADIALSLEQVGVPGTASRTVETHWQRNNRRLLDVTADGTLLKAGKRWHLMPPSFFFTTDAIDRYEAAVKEATQKEDLLFTWAQLSESLKESGNPDFEQAAGRIKLVNANQISLSINKETGEIRPYFLKANATPGAERKNFEPLLSKRHLARAENQFNSDWTAPKHFALDNNTFLFLPEETRLILQAVQQAAHGTPEEKARLFANPNREILRRLEGKADPDALEALVGNTFVESPEFLSDRVQAFGPWSPKLCGFVTPIKTDWFGDDETHRWSVMVGGQFVTGTEEELQSLLGKIKDAKENGTSHIDIDKVPVEVESIDVGKLEQFLENLSTGKNTSIAEPKEAPSEDIPEVNEQRKSSSKDTSEEDKPVRFGPILQDNLNTLQYIAETRQRDPFLHELEGLNPAFNLLPHQVEALNWLKNLWNKGIPGALLADDMGLGKTLQCLSFLRWVSQGYEEQDHPHPALVVAPVGLLPNWANEGQKYFGGRMHEPIVLTGKKATLALKRPRPELLHDLESADWVLTNYETIRDKFELFCSINWSVVVFDEAQKIKNPVSLMTETAKSLQSDFTLMMTGTPVENSFSDLWCIMDTAVPGFMGSLNEFNQRYGNDNDIEKSGAELNAVLTGQALTSNNEKVVRLMMRRLKTERLKNLPEKRTEVIPVVMPNKQRQAYQAILEARRHDPENPQNTPLAVLARLADCSLSPEPLFESTELTDDLIQGSARLTAFFQILDDIAAKREKVVVFVQHFDVQTVVARAIKTRYKLDHIPGKINGKMATEARQKVVTAFQNGLPGFDAVVLTGRAAGTGLTLTAANHVIHLERWWNPAVEDQCSDRVFRIGQTKDVTIHIPLALLPPSEPQSFDATLNDFLEKKRSRSTSVLLPSLPSEGDKAFMASFFKSEEDKV